MRSPRPRRARRGQALAELALSLPILLAVLVLVVEGTLMISAKHRLMDAVHQAARAASRTHMEEDEIRQRIATIVSSDPLLDPELLDVEVEVAFDSNGGDTLSVSAGIPVRPVTLSILGTFTLRSAATYRLPPRDDGRPS